MKTWTRERTEELRRLAAYIGNDMDDSEGQATCLDAADTIESYQSALANIRNPEVIPKLIAELRNIYAVNADYNVGVTALLAALDAEPEKPHENR